MSDPAKQEQTEPKIYRFSVGRFTLETDGSVLSVLDSEGNEVIEQSDRAEAIEQSVEMFSKFGSAFNHELQMQEIVAGSLLKTMSITKAKATFAANENFEISKLGYVDDKGWRFEGISKTTGKRLWSAEKDSGIMTWHNAIKYTQELKDFQGYDGSKITSKGDYTSIEERLKKEDDGGARLATIEELNQMWENQKNGLCDNNFNSADPDYWSLSESTSSGACYQRFSDGKQTSCYKYFVCSVRVVRSEPC